MPFWASQLGSTNEKHCKAHIKEIITDKINVETTTINEIIRDYNIKEIELLHCDTEGHDYDILINFDFITNIAKELNIIGVSDYVRVSELKKQAVQKLIDNVDHSQVLDYL